MRENKFYLEDDNDEANLLIEELNKEIDKDRDSLDLTIALTNKCNFNCIYCYQDKKAQTMNIETAQNIIEKIECEFEKNKYQEINIHYFGGEPLLNIAVLRYFDDKFVTLSEKYNVIYNAYLTTNGSKLTKGLLAQIKFKAIQLTFDGFEETHNRLRVSKEFKHKQEFELIRMILDNSNSMIILRMNACKENKEEIIPFLKLVLDIYGNERIIFNLNKMIKFHEEDKFEMLSNIEFAKLEWDKQLLLEKYGASSELPIRHTYNCRFLVGGAYSIDTNGNCNLCSGSSDEGNISFKKCNIQTRKKLSISETCKECKILPLCLGGCKVQRDLGYEVCSYQKYYLDEILYHYINTL